MKSFTVTLRPGTVVLSHPELQLQFNLLNRYVEKAKGLALESKYPSELGKTSSVTGKNGKCKHIAPAGGKPAGFTYATKPCTQGACKKQNLKTLAANVASKAPASICVNAGAWQNYVKGTMTVKKCGGFSADDLDHCVQV